jgi:hypothetical protein
METGDFTRLMEYRGGSHFKETQQTKKYQGTNGTQECIKSTKVVRWNMDVGQVWEVGQTKYVSKSQAHRDVPMSVKFKP